MKRSQGFTLIELVLVIAIIASLAIVIVPKFSNQGPKAKDATSMANLESLRTVIDMFKTDTGAYPTQATFTADLVDGTTQYIRKIPADGKKKVNAVKASVASPMVAGDVDDAGGWVYDQATGHIAPNLSGNDYAGVSYFSY